MMSLKNCLRILLLSWTLALLFEIAVAKVEIRFNFLKCAPMENEVMKLHECSIKLVARKTYAAKMSATIKRNVTNVLFHARLMKKENGWHPFLYDLQFDVCDFFRNPDKHFLAKLAYNEVKNFTNVHHPCPYLEGEFVYVDFKVPKMDRIAQLLKRFPVDTGEYGLFTGVSVDNKYFGTVNGSATYSDYAKVH